MYIDIKDLAGSIKEPLEAKLMLGVIAWEEGDEIEAGSSAQI